MRTTTVPRLTYTILMLALAALAFRGWWLA
jgi:hypothetical protein